MSFSNRVCSKEEALVLNSVVISTLFHWVLEVVDHSEWIFVVHGFFVQVPLDVNSSKGMFYSRLGR